MDPVTVGVLIYLATQGAKRPAGAPTSPVKTVAPAPADKPATITDYAKACSAGATIGGVVGGVAGAGVGSVPGAAVGSAVGCAAGLVIEGVASNAAAIKDTAASAWDSVVAFFTGDDEPVDHNKRGRT